MGAPNVDDFGNYICRISQFAPPPNPVVPPGTSNNSGGDGPPVDPPADPTQVGFYVDFLTGITYSWNPNTQAWT